LAFDYKNRKIIRSLKWVFILFLGGCAVIGGKNYSDLYGPSEPRDREVAELAPRTVDYWNDVQPILENRCTVCHGCYDAPCQLKLTSKEGLERGASAEMIYDQTRVFEAKLSRLFEDAQTVSQW
jgi:hypothetical protein